MTASRVSHSTSSNGWTPSLVKYRLNDSPFSFTEMSRSFVAMTPPVRLSGKDYIGVIRGAYYTPEAEPCQASFSQYVALSGRDSYARHNILWCPKSSLPAPQDIVGV